VQDDPFKEMIFQTRGLIPLRDQAGIILHFKKEKTAAKRLDFLQHT